MASAISPSDPPPRSYALTSVSPIAMPGTHEPLTIAKSAITLVVLACALNLTIISLCGGYDLQIGSLHLGAHSLFKAIQELEGAWLLAILILGIGAVRSPLAEWPVSFGFWSWFGLLTAGTLGLYASSLSTNFSHHDWNHRHISAGITSIRDAASLFVTPQADGFYRPLTFLSLWVDFRVFGSALWGYHLQSIALHIANALAVRTLALRLGFPEALARWAALLFACAAVNFEPVLWPAARFDVLATLFTTLALISAIEYLQAPGASPISVLKTGLFLTLGLLNKESAYCFPLVLGCLIALRRPDFPKAVLVPRVRVLTVTAGSVIIVMLCLRFAIYHGLGGYPAADGVSPQFSYGWRTVTSLLTRIPLSILGLNTSFDLPSWTKMTLVVFAAFLGWLAVRRAYADGDQMLLLACAFVTAIPTLNIIGWIGPSMQHSRYLYQPTIWMALFLTGVVSRLPRAPLLLGVLLCINVAGVIENLRVYRVMLRQTDTLAQAVQEDYMREPSLRGVSLAAVPGEPYGVFFFRSELAEKIKQRLPQVDVREDDGPVLGCDELVYKWDAARSALLRSAVATECLKH